MKNPHIAEMVKETLRQFAMENLPQATMEQLVQDVESRWEADVVRYVREWMMLLIMSKALNQSPLANADRPIPSASDASGSPNVLTYSIAEVADIMGVSYATVYRLIERRMLKPIPGLRHKRISKKQVHAFIQNSANRDS